jgi:hypothetical protein
MANIVVFSQATVKNDENFAEQNLRLFTDSARLAGCHVHYVPQAWDECTADDALYYLQTQGHGVFLGFINENSYYEELYEAALKKGVQLINSPKQSMTAMEFAIFAPLIHDLTPKSSVVHNPDLLSVAVEAVGGFPVFVKGGIKSDKEGGWEACVVGNMDDLEARFRWFANRPITARSHMVLRQIAPLRKTGKIVGGFPESREYRTFLFDGRMIGYGYYWRPEDPFGELQPTEVAEVVGLAELAAQRIGCPLMAIDVGQLEDGSWIVIETGDLQYSGVTQMPPMLFWNELHKRLE